MLTKNQLRGLIIYPFGDLIAQLILGELNLFRIVTLSLVGCFIYSYEIGAWFAFIQNKYSNPLLKTFLAILYFNPLWIARHFLFIELAINYESFLSLTEFGNLFVKVFQIAINSFLGGFLLSLLANYLIQNKLNLKNRFLFSAIFSALMAIYYALTKVWF